MKFQKTTSPAAVAIHVAGPIEGPRHDGAWFVRSGIEQHLDSMCTVYVTQCCVHADGGYNRRSSADVPFRGTDLSHSANAANNSTASVRVTLEWSYQAVKLRCSTKAFKQKLRVGEEGDRLPYLGAVLLHDVRHCFYLNAVLPYFSCSPPSFEECLRCKE